MDYVVYYDILESWSGAEIGVAGLLVGVLLGIFFLLRGIKRHKNFEVMFSVFWLAGWVCLGSVLLGIAYSQHFRCVQWARSGDYQTIEGPITNFKEYRRSADEEFSVGNVHFAYSPDDLSICGFKQLVREGSPVKDGLHVRIAYKNGRILKLEIATKNQ